MAASIRDLVVAPGVAVCAAGQVRSGPDGPHRLTFGELRAAQSGGEPGVEFIPAGSFSAPEPTIHTDDYALICESSAVVIAGIWDGERVAHARLVDLPPAWAEVRLGTGNRAETDLQAAAQAAGDQLISTGGGASGPLLRVSRVTPELAALQPPSGLCGLLPRSCRSLPTEMPTSGFRSSRPPLTVNAV